MVSDRKKFSSRTLNFTKAVTPPMGNCLRRCRPAATQTEFGRLPDCIWRCSSPIELLPLAKASRCAGCSMTALRCLRTCGEAIWLASTSQVVASHRVWSRMTRRRCRTGAAESDDAPRRTRESRRASSIHDSVWDSSAQSLPVRAPGGELCVAARSRCIFRTEVVILYLWQFA